MLLALGLGSVAAALSAGCAATVRPPHPTSVDESRARVRWPGTTLAMLQQGRSIYVERCAACHTLFAPSAHRAADWPALLGEMAEKAHLEGPEREAVLQYLVTMAEASEQSAAPPAQAASAAQPSSTAQP